MGALLASAIPVTVEISTRRAKAAQMSHGYVMCSQTADRWVHAAGPQISSWLPRAGDKWGCYLIG